MNTSDDGVHAASIGGIWKSAVFGFAGIRFVDGKLTINPRLPEAVASDEIYDSLARTTCYTIHYKFNLSVKVENKEKIEFESLWSNSMNVMIL